MHLSALIYDEFHIVTQLGETCAEHLDDADPLTAWGQCLIHVSVVILIEYRIQHVRSISSGSTEQKLRVFAVRGGGQWNYPISVPSGNLQLTIRRCEPNSFVSHVNIEFSFKHLNIFHLQIVKMLGRFLRAKLLHMWVMVVEGDLKVKKTSRVKQVSDTDCPVKATIVSTRTES